MVRVVRRVEVCCVTIVARRRQPLVHIIHMTLYARCGLVSAGEWEACVAVVERRRLPRRCRMAGTAIMIEVPGNMVRIRRLRKLDLMTLVAIVEHELVIPVCVATLALRRDMRARQWEVRRVMIE